MLRFIPDELAPHFQLIPLQAHLINLIHGCRGLLAADAVFFEGFDGVAGLDGMGFVPLRSPLIARLGISRLLAHIGNYILAGPSLATAAAPLSSELPSLSRLLRSINPILRDI